MGTTEAGRVAVDREVLEREIREDKEVIAETKRQRDRTGRALQDIKTAVSDLRDAVTRSRRSRSGK